jgi:hypothetical protein
MSVLVRKEIRLLAPAWIAALAAATMPLWFGQDRQDSRGLSLPCFGLALVFLGLTTLGKEMSWGTFGLLLSQPEKRERFWSVKVGLLQGAVLSAWAVFAFCWWLCYRHADQWFLSNFGSFADMAGATGLLALLAFSGGLWSTLLLRDVMTAFFAAVLVPSAIYGATTVLCSIFWEDAPRVILFLPLEIYAVAGFYAARRLFLRAQDVAWSGGQISLATGRARVFRRPAFGFRKKRGPLSALICKELQLQQVTLVIVPLLLVLHLAALAARHFWSTNMQVFDFAGALWLVAPFVVGCVAVAEERRFNTLEGSLCLPVRKRSQFWVKFAVVVALGTVLGGVLPSVLECWGGGISVFGDDGRTGTASLTQFVWPAAAIAAISFFASTMCRGMLQAFTVALLFPILLGVSCVLLIERVGLGAYGVEFGGLLYPVLFWPALIVASIWMAFRNYIRLQTGWALWAGNSARFIAVFASVLLVAGSIYNRCWEYFMDLEPHHGPARLSGAGRAMIAVSCNDGSYSWNEGSYYALLPDGRLWAGKFDEKSEGHIQNVSGHFAAGSNWVDLASTYTNRAVAMKSDGTLWKLSRQGDPSQIGSDTDWKKVVAGRSWFLALKQDGTIWGWGVDSVGILSSRTNAEGRGLKFPDPVEIWPEPDWADLLDPPFLQAVAVKRDGSLWKWGPRQDLGGRIINYADYHQLVPAGIGGGNWSSLAGSFSELLMGVRTDGGLWAGASRRSWEPEDAGDPILFGTHIPRNNRDRVGELVRLGNKSDWVGVSLAGQQYLALEADGTFWAIDFFSMKPKRPSKYHDWLAASGTSWTIWTLASDGTINCWADFSREEPFPPYDDSLTNHFIHHVKLSGTKGLEFPDAATLINHFIHLRPSRRPLASINILDAKPN